MIVTKLDFRQLEPYEMKTYDLSPEFDQNTPDHLLSWKQERAFTHFVESHFFPASITTIDEQLIETKL